jgi:hypothetical protein
MPTMPRPAGKGKKIAYAILGVPQNMRDPEEKTVVQRNERRLLYESTIRER